MDEAMRAAEAVAEWDALVDRAEAQLSAGMVNAGAAPEIAHAREATARARALLKTLARGEEAIKAEYPGTRREQDTLRDLSPVEALRSARWSRDAILRLGVWSVLGDWAGSESDPKAPRRSIRSLVATLSRAAASAPPGIAPTPGYADTDDAVAFFNGHLHRVIGRLAEEYDGDQAAFARALDHPPMNRTVGLAQLWSGPWSDAACAVYADWLDRRGNGSLDAARRGLWQYSGKSRPVRFRPAGGLAVIPTKGHRLHVDLWLQPVLAQVLAFDAARWSARAMNGRWHAVRLAIHDLGARDVGDSADGPRTLHRGLSIEMLYEAIFIDRMSALARGDVVRPEPAAAVAEPHAFDVAVPGCCDGQQMTLRVVLDWRRPAPPPQASRRIAARPAAELNAEQLRAIRHWQADPGRSGERLALHAGIEIIEADRLDWRPARARHAEGEAEGACATMLGHADLWGTLDASAQWCDIAALARIRERWVTLPLEPIDEVIDGRLRTWLTLDADDAQALAAAGIDIPLLQERLGEAANSLWVCRRAGLGLFLSLGVDLTAATA